MARKRKSWREKLEGNPDLPKVVEDKQGRGRMLIAKPTDVDALMRQIKPGKVATVAQIMERLADDFDADLTCPMTTGIFIRIVAEVAEEDFELGKKRVTPYWRVIKSDGSLNPKYPGGTQAQSAHLQEEGHSILPAKGKKPPRVRNFEKALQEL